MKNGSRSLLTLVTGDITMDWNLARVGRGGRGGAVWRPDSEVDVFWQRGGALLLADLLKEVGLDVSKKTAIPVVVRYPEAPTTPSEVTPGDPRFSHSYAMWSEKKYAEKPASGKEKAWRVEEFLGIRRADTSNLTRISTEDSADADIFVLDDADLGFRDAKECWPLSEAMTGKKPAWIVYKMAKPVANGPLWEYLHQQYADRMVVVTTINDLRLTEVQISRELSWERTAQDVLWELVHNPCVNGLSHCAHVIISFGAAGAILLTRQKTDQTSRCFLIFDPRFIEGVWESEYPGGVIGYTTCLMAGIAREIMLKPEDPDIPRGIQSGLAAMRNLHADGYGEKGRPLSQSPLVFPISRIAAVLGQETAQFAQVEVQDPLRFIRQPLQTNEKPLTSGFWTILQDRYRGALDQVAEQIVRAGPQAALQGVPLGQFGNLLTVDRQEIESFRSIRALVGEYCQQGQQKRPLSIAVFGAPGSGKSFGIIEVANSLLPGQIDVREFNLSQFTSPNDLISALHQVRDVGLTGKIPLIFWDEFDTSFNGVPLGWLRYFLAPMQDGRFQEGQISHPIGRSIFVFAGGTAATMAKFESQTAAFSSAKGPDFVSRLKGYVNILGPNPLSKDGDTAGKDPYYIIRRAILLRSILKRSTPELFEKDKLNMDSGVLRALLRTREYRHGVRSIESIIMMSQLAGKKSFERSSLPAESQLDIHVDGQDFLALVQQIELTGAVLEALAKAAHQVYCEGLRARGVQILLPEEYEGLSDEVKDQNRQNVRDIPAKLAIAGYVMIPARSNEPSFDFPGEALEKLAELEHERWMRAKLADGWRWGAQTDPEARLNSALVSWGDLPEPERVKDRDLMRGIPKILARAGYAIVPSHSGK